MRGRAFLVAALLAPGVLRAQDGWVRRSPVEARQTGVFARRDLDESSGLAVSRRSRGILWTIEDSGNDPLLIATDTLGRDRGAWTLRGAANRDWEAVRVGPCGTASCVYIADTGDNGSRRNSVTVYRVREPRASDSPVALRADSIVIRYPGGARDVEAMIVTPAGDLLFISKVRSGPSMLYRVPAAAWRRDRAVEAEEVGALAIPARGESFDRVTDAALAPDGRRVLVLTYASVYFFTLAGSRLIPARPQIACGVLGLQAVSEGADWLSNDEIVIAGESAFGVRGGIAIVRCPQRIE